MNSTRPAAFPVNHEPFADGFTADGARLLNMAATANRISAVPAPDKSRRAVVAIHMSELEWRRSLKVGDTVAVFCASRRFEDGVVTSAPATRITIGKYAGRMSFDRATGKLCGKRPLAHLFRIGRPT
jgi:hypothetical protein